MGSKSEEVWILKVIELSRMVSFKVESEIEGGRMLFKKDEWDLL